MALYKTQTRFLFHAHIKIKLPYECDEACFDRIYGVLESVDKHYNSYQPGSYIDIVNKQAGSWVEVDGETVALLKLVKRWAAFFHGAFDPTVMPLLRLWGFYKDEVRTVPSRQDIARALSKVDYRRIETDGLRVRIGKEQEIITGSFIKAYAVDKAVGELRRMGITDAIINAGGSTICAVNNKEHPAWDVNVRDTDTGKLLFTLALGNRCYTTSSQERTFVDINGRHYGHILNPLTGYPSLNRHVGIVTEDCVDGDMLSTGLFVGSAQGFGESMDRLGELLSVDGFFMDHNGSVTSTLGFNRYIKADK